MDLTHDHYDQMRIEVMHNMFGFGYGVRIWQRTNCNDGVPKTLLADRLTMREVKRGQMIKHNTLELDRDSAQELMDGLWQVGVRPANGEGNVGQIGAMREHLGDLRMDKKFLQQLVTEAFCNQKPVCTVDIAKLRNTNWMKGEVNERPEL